jgi:hypothetical protein
VGVKNQGESAFGHGTTRKILEFRTGGRSHLKSLNS